MCASTRARGAARLICSPDAAAPDEPFTPPGPPEPLALHGSPPPLPFRLRYAATVLGTLAGLLGLQLGRRCARALARRTNDLEPPICRSIRTNIRAALLEFDEEVADRLAAECLQHLAMFWSETLWAAFRLTPSKCPAAVNVSPRMQDCLTTARGKPVVLVTGYLGNPVLGMLALSRFVAPVHVLVDPLAGALLAARPWVTARFPGLHVVPAGAGEKLGAALEKSHRVVLLLGLSPRLGGVDCNLFGQVRRHSAAAARLALRHGADVVVFCCRRDEQDGLELDLLDHIEPRAGCTAAAITQRCLEAIERESVRRPEQYLWARR